MSLWPCNSINNLRVYPKPVAKECHPLPGRWHSDPVLAERSVHLIQVSTLLSPLSISERALSQCIPLTIFHSARREPRPWHSPGHWLAERLETLSSSPESHVADACLQTSAKSHGNGRRFTVNHLPLTQIPDVVPRACYEKNENNK